MASVMQNYRITPVRDCGPHGQGRNEQWQPKPFRVWRSRNSEVNLKVLHGHEGLEGHDVLNVGARTVIVAMTVVLGVLALRRAVGVAVIQLEIRQARERLLNKLHLLALVRARAVVVPVAVVLWMLALGRAVGVAVVELEIHGVEREVHECGGSEG